ncbi:ribonuclease H-like domain-containing protein [Tanacetum coccineum]
MNNQDLLVHLLGQLGFTNNNNVAQPSQNASSNTSLPTVQFMRPVAYHAFASPPCYANGPASSVTLLRQIIASLQQEFSMTDLGSLNYFLGISVTRDSSGMFLSQKKYAVEILDRAHMVNCNPSQTPIILSLNREVMVIRSTDAYWAGCPTTRRSTSGYCVFLGNNLLSWSTKRQLTLSRSSAEAEYRGIANSVAETCWLCNLLRELHNPLSFATLVYYDNVSAVYLSCNSVQHQRTKHIEIDIHFVHDLVIVGQVRVLHVPSPY